MKKSPLICVPFLFLACTNVASASPTLRGLQVDDPSEETDLYTDTGNPELIYVTPPRIGTLQVTQQSFAVDEDTCRSVAEINATRLSELSTRAELLDQIETITEKRSQIIADGIKDSLEAKTISAEIEAWDAILGQTVAQLNQLDERIEKVEIPKHLLESAGYYGFVAKAPWSEAIGEVASANSTKTVNAIPTTNAEVFVSVLDAEGFEPNELIAAVNTGNISDVSSVVEGLQIDVEPTKIGACFIKYPQIIGSAAKEYAFGVTINYTHKVAVTTTVHAAYNLKDVYEHLSRGGRKGGFFSRKSWSEVIENRDIDTVFNLTVEFETDVSPEAAEIERQRVREFMVGTAVAEMTSKLVPAGDPGKSGATIAAETLTKACGPNAYCAGAAAGLTILDGIFGRSKTSANLKQVIEVTQTYDSKVVEAIDIPGTISFIYKN